ncbi:MAG: HD domain-containing phosphohydrolase, partial [Nitrospirota bacterium]|nr:HD domain-containing phosphohydrolase [Nitrospirota bacterium]
HKRLIRHIEDIQLLRQCGVRKLKIDPSQGLDLEPLPPGERPPSPDIQEQTDGKETSATGTTSIEVLRLNNAAHPTDRLQPSDSTGHTPPSTTEQPIAGHVAGTTERSSPPTKTQDSPGNQGTSLSSNAEQSTASTQPSPAGLSAPSSEDTAPLAPGTEGQPAQARSPDPQKQLHPGQATIQAAEAQKTYTESITSMERMFEELEAGIVPRPATLRLVVSNVLSRVLDDSSGMLSLLFLQKMKRFDRTLASHALDVCTLALIVAQTYGIPEGEMEALGAGALLHDIGYVRLPRNLYRKNHDLTEQERTVMQQHPALGQAILREAKEDRDAVVRIVAEHHERSDGSGFPHKLQGDSLSVLAQLVGLVDAYDGMVSRRGGRPAMLPHDAIRQLFRLGDTGQYAKELIQAMIGSLGVYPIGSLVQLNTTEQAVVVGMNPTQRLKPIIKVIMGAQGESYFTPILVDLGAQAVGASARSITKVMDPLQERVNVALFLETVEPEAA